MMKLKKEYKPLDAFITTEPEKGVYARKKYDDGELSLMPFSLNVTIEMDKKKVCPRRSLEVIVRGGREFRAFINPPAATEKTCVCCGMCAWSPKKKTRIANLKRSSTK